MYFCDVFIVELLRMAERCASMMVYWGGTIFKNHDVLRYDNGYKRVINVAHDTTHSALVDRCMM